MQQENEQQYDNEVENNSQIDDGKDSLSDHIEFEDGNEKIDELLKNNVVESDSPYEEESDESSNYEEYEDDSNDCHRTDDECDEKKEDKTMMRTLTMKLFREQSEYYLGNQISFSI